MPLEWTAKSDNAEYAPARSVKLFKWTGKIFFAYIFSQKKFHVLCEMNILIFR